MWTSSSYHMYILITCEAHFQKSIPRIMVTLPPPSRIQPSSWLPTQYSTYPFRKTQNAANTPTSLPSPLHSPLRQHITRPIHKTRTLWRVSTETTRYTYWTTMDSRNHKEGTRNVTAYILCSTQYKLLIGQLVSPRNTMRQGRILPSGKFYTAQFEDGSHLLISYIY